MDNTKYLAGISIVGLVLILGLTINVSAMPYIAIGNATHNFTVVPGQEADISLPIMVKNINVSNTNEAIKGLQFNVTFNCSMINITNVTDVNIVNVTNAQVKIKIYNNMCNNSPLSTGLQKAFCFYMNTTLTTNNKTNASILFAAVKNISDSNNPDKCVLRIYFASYKNLAGDVEIGKIKMHVKGMENYFNTNFTLPMNITIEKMGSNGSANGHINVSDANIQSQARLNGLIKACRGDADKNGKITISDAMFIAQYKLGSSYKYYKNLTDLKECLDVDNDGKITISDAMFIAQYKLGSSYKYYKNLTTY